MSSISTTTINTANATTPLTLATGNTAGPSLIVDSGTDVFIRANTTANVFIANSTSIRANAAVTVANSLTITGLTTVNTSSFTGNANFININATAVSSTNSTVTGTLTLATSSRATEGFTTLPNGLLMCWGSASGTTTGTAVTFSRAFSAAPYAVTLGTTASNDEYLGGIGASGFTLYSDATQTVYWMAIGPY